MSIHKYHVKKMSAQKIRTILPLLLTEIDYTSTRRHLAKTRYEHVHERHLLIDKNMISYFCIIINMIRLIMNEIDVKNMISKNELYRMSKPLKVC